MFCYSVGLAVLSFLWELAQMPLYTLWDSATALGLIRNALECTAANLVIGVLSLAAAKGVLRRLRRSDTGRPTATAGIVPTTCAIAVAYTVLSETINVYVLETWAYSERMPIVPVIDVGLAPLVQWIVLPSLAILCAEGLLR